MIESITRSSADVIKEVERSFGDESGVQVTESDIIRWINRAQLAIVMRNPEVGQAVAMANIVAAQADYPLIANVPTVLTIQSIHVNNKPVKHLPFQEAESFLMNAPAGTSDEIEFWYERGGIVTLYPTPATSITNGIKFYFNKRPADITTNSQLLSVPDHYYNSVVDFCNEQAQLMDENSALAGIFGQKFEQGVTQMKERTQTQTDYYPFITQSEDW